MHLTFKTKIKSDNVLNAYFDDYAKLFNMLEHKLYVAIIYKKKTKTELKKQYILLYKITARQFNSIYTSIKGKLDAIKALKKKELMEKNLKKKKLINNLLKLKEKSDFIKDYLITHKQNDEDFSDYIKQNNKVKFSIHQKKRKLECLNHKIKYIEDNLRNGVVRICFGGSKLFNMQYNMDYNIWKEKWQKNRSSNIYYLGSKDESYGNQNCQYTENNEIFIRVAPVLVKKYGQYIKTSKVIFKYGQNHIDECKKNYYVIKNNGKKQKYYKAMNHRFFKTEHGLYLHTTVSLEDVDIKSKGQNGTIGVDFNVNFISIAIIDRFGNPIEQKKVTYEMYNRSTNYISNNLSLAIKEIVAIVNKNELPICIEDLDFKKSKLFLNNKNKKYRKMLSHFPYRKFMDKIEVRCIKDGIKLFKVNPANTSKIGKKYTKRYGLSSHHGAAIIIGRRGLGYTDKRLIKAS